MEQDYFWQFPPPEKIMPQSGKFECALLFLRIFLLHKRYKADKSLMLYAPATWHTCEPNAEEERSQINSSQMLVSRPVLVRCPILTDILTGQQSLLSGFWISPVECTRGWKSNFPAVSCVSLLNLFNLTLTEAKSWKYTEYTVKLSQCNAV